MMSEKMIEKMNECFHQCAELLPSIEKIDDFEDNFKELNNLSSGLSHSILRDAQVFEAINTDNDISERRQKTETLSVYQNKIDELKNKLSLLDVKYDKMLKEKEILQENMKEFVTDSDIVLAYKLGTLSHFCYDKKTWFGFFKNDKTLDYGTFPCNMDENSSEELECRWKLLKSFISTQNTH